MRISRAAALGTCFGVRDAIEAALDESFRDDLTIVGELVHNPQVVERLRRHGVAMVKSADESIATRHAMITAHGAPASLRARLEERGLTVYDASCPLVIKVHNRVAALVREGYFPVVIGQREHVEVRGIVGDLDEYAVLGCEEDLQGCVDLLAGRDRIGIVSQTTQQVEVARALAAAVEERFPEAEVRFVDTICKPTKDRQRAVRELAAVVDLMIVIGGRNSSNTKKLLQVCLDRGLPAHHVTHVGDLRGDWFAGRQHVGITAGTSTPEEVIAEIEGAIRSLAEGRGAPDEGDRAVPS